MIFLSVIKMEVLPRGASVTFRAFNDSNDATHEFSLPVSSYEMGAWAESVGVHINLDPKLGFFPGGRPPQPKNSCSLEGDVTFF